VLPEQALAAPTTHPSAFTALAAEQQPEWQHHRAFRRTLDTLGTADPLVSPAELGTLRSSLATVAAGGARVLQIGDCAESFYECTAARTTEKLDSLGSLADHLGTLTGQPTVQIGRMGGQFAKPRSQPTERHGDREIPAFRGHLVNSEVPTAAARQHDPRRMLWAYEASAKVLRRVREHRARRTETEPSSIHSGPWSSHEALVVDYEGALVRAEPDTDARYLASTHLPWIGERTRQLDSAHVHLLASVVNPVGCKIGPKADPEAVLRLCALLDPDRVPGRLVLIIRMGRDAIGQALPEVVRRVRDAGHPVVWLNDPMHGNTVRSSAGVKTRRLDDVVAEAVSFRDILERHGEHAGGLHLETAADDVTECVGGSVPGEERLTDRYTTLCDPRLNPDQAQRLLRAWA